MARVVLAFSISLDGFVAGSGISRERPMGEGGERLHDWLFKSDAEASTIDRTVASKLRARVGAVVLGRRTYDIGVDLWGDTPYPVPSFVLTHRDHPSRIMTSATFSFITGGIASAISQARAVASEKDVIVMGAETARECLVAGLADELVLQLIPILLGAGSRLFDPSPPSRPTLEVISAVPSPNATHLHYRIVRP
jgi:dihydrofolate reductase